MSKEMMARHTNTHAHSAQHDSDWLVLADSLIGSASLSIVPSVFFKFRLHLERGDVDNRVRLGLSLLRLCIVNRVYDGLSRGRSRQRRHRVLHLLLHLIIHFRQLNVAIAM